MRVHASLLHDCCPGTTCPPPACGPLTGQAKRHHPLWTRIRGVWALGGGWGGRGGASPLSKPTSQSCLNCQVASNDHDSYLLQVVTRVSGPDPRVLTAAACAAAAAVTLVADVESIRLRGGVVSPSIAFSGSRYASLVFCVHHINCACHLR